MRSYLKLALMERYPEGDIALEYTGLRLGEKLYEELLIDGGASTTAHPRIFHAHEEKVNREEYQEILDNLTTACNRRDVERIYSMLKTYVSGFKRDERVEGQVVNLPLGEQKKVS